jgi:DNA-binding response OmpR family regulator
LTQSRPTPPDAERPLVLAADDDEDILELVSLTLRRGGCDVIKARDGDEALQTAFERRPDLIVLDVMMPRKDGYQVVAALRRDDRTSLVPVIFLSARAGRADANYGRQVGADDFIQKPFDSVAFLDRVQALLRRG